MKVGYRYGEIQKAEYERQTVTLIFNALNGAFLSATSVPYSDVDVTDPLCIYVVDEMNLIEDKVVGGLKIEHNEDGTYTWEADYKIMPQDDGTITIYESQMDMFVAESITKRYKITDQINILAKSIKILADVAGINIEELEEYLDFVEEVKDTNRKHIEQLKEQEGYEFISNEELAEQQRLTYEGGIHERIGGREIMGGRVF